MLKKILIGSFAFMTVTLLCSIGAVAETFETSAPEESDFKVSLDWDTPMGCVITSYEGDDAEVIIPQQIDGRDVTRIGAGAFAGNTAVKSVVIPEGVEVIAGDTGDWDWFKGAFEDCVNLESVTLPSTLIKIEFDAFTNTKIINSQTDPVKYVDSWLIECTDPNIASVEVKDGTIGIVENAFRNFDYDDETKAEPNTLKSVTLPDSLKVIGDSAFYGCAVEDITLPSGLTYIGNEAFYGCPIKELIIPDGVTAINNKTFYKCAIKKLKLPSELISIGEKAFSGCPIERVTLPDTLEDIGIGAFSGTNLKKITIPEYVTVIKGDIYGGGTFENCKNLVKVTFKGNITDIQYEAFANCIALKSVTFPDSLTEIGARAFYGCEILANIRGGTNIESIGAAAFNVYTDNKDISYVPYFENQKTGLKYLGKKWVVGYKGNKTSVTVPKSVLGIAGGAFYESDVRNVTVSEGVEYIGENAFARSEIEEVTLPATLKELGSSAFMYCNNLKKVKFKAGLGYIPDSTFYCCRSLEEIVIPDGTVYISTYNDESAFAGCESLKKITIPKSLTSVPDSVFYCCDSVTDIYYEGSEEDWKNVNIGDDNGSLKKAKVHYNSKLPYYASLKTLKKVSGVKAAASSNKIKISWEKLVGAEGYNIEMYAKAKYSDNYFWTSIADVKDAENYTVKGLESGTEYKLRIRAYYTQGNNLIYGEYTTFSVKTK